MNGQTLRDVVDSCFRRVHEGRSTDDVIIDDRLNDAFIRACHRIFPDATACELNSKLMTLRKANKMGSVATKRRILNHDEYAHASEIAARFMEDKHGKNIDRVFCDPELRHKFDEVAHGIEPDVEPYRLRKAALGLRKKRKLRPELIKRIADWGREVSTHDATELKTRPDLIPRRPGVYLLHDATGYLYIGEASDLRSRVSKHLDHSDRRDLARYLWDQEIADIRVDLHTFEPSSDGAKVGHRRAYESELIAKRQPRFNIRP